MDYCLTKNLNNPLIDQIFVLNECDLDIFSKKVILIPIKRRPLFDDFFTLINENTDINDYNIIANSDIFFDETLSYFLNYRNYNLSFALTRWNIANDKNQLQNTYFYSQDVWIFKGKVRDIDGNFGFGLVGCDNRIAYEIRKTRYLVRNPSLTIKAYHYHNLNFINSYPDNFPNRVSPPYYYPIPYISIYDKNYFQIKKLIIQLKVVSYWIYIYYFEQFWRLYRIIRKKIIMSVKKILYRQNY